MCFVNCIITPEFRDRQSFWIRLYVDNPHKVIGYYDHIEKPIYNLTENEQALIRYANAFVTHQGEIGDPETNDNTLNYVEIIYTAHYYLGYIPHIVFH